MQPKTIGRVFKEKLENNPRALALVSLKGNNKLRYYEYYNQCAKFAGGLL